MANFTFKPNFVSQSRVWNNPSTWVEGAVPNSTDADVLIPTATRPDGSLFPSNISLVSDITVGSISVSNNTVSVDTNDLLVVGNAVILPGGIIVLQDGGSLTAASLSNAGRLVLFGGTVSAAQFAVTSGGSIELSTGTLTASHLTVDANGQVKGAGTINGAVANSGVVTAKPQISGFSVGGVTLVINGAVSGDGKLEVGFAVQNPFNPRAQIGATLELNGPVSQNVVFDDGRGKLKLGDPAHFTGSIATQIGADVVLTGIGLNSLVDASYLGDSHGGILTLELASGHLDLNFSGFFDIASFDFSGDSQNLTISNFRQMPSSSGNVEEWLLKDGLWWATAGPGSHAAGARVAAVADFTGDGVSDILWQNVNTGAVDFWRMAHGANTSGDNILSHPPGYQAAGGGDFNHNGTADVFWFNPPNGATDIWLMSGGNRAGSVNSGNHPTGYQVAGIGDLTGDGTSDVLWFNPTTGNVDLWKMSGGKWAGSINVGSHPGSGWLIGGVGDFNNDGTSDVFWFNPGSGATDIWLLANGAWAASVSPGNHPAGGTSPASAI